MTCMRAPARLPLPAASNAVCVQQCWQLAKQLAQVHACMSRCSSATGHSAVNSEHTHRYRVHACTSVSILLWQKLDVCQQARL